MEMVYIRTVFEPVTAQLLRSRLDAAGIPAEVTHELSALSTDGYSLATGGIGIKVPAEYLDAARELLSVDQENDASSA